MTGPGPNGGGPRRPRVARVGEVVRTSYLTPHMIRVVLGGDGLAGFPTGEFTDHYVKLVFPDQSPDPERPVTRTYTVRAWDAAAGELTLDFVWHGDEGLAGPWAAAAQPGDRISFFGPGGGYAPSPDADWHLLAGDESALPAIGAALDRLPTGARVLASSRSPARRRSRPSWTAGTASSWSGCTAATLPPARPSSPPSGAPPCPRAPATCSCTARPAPSASCAGTCARPTACRASSPRSRATGGAATPRTAGRPPSVSGTPRSPPRRPPSPDVAGITTECFRRSEAC